MAYPGAPPPPYTPQTGDPNLIVNPPVPYIGPLTSLCDGYMITINGRVLPKADRFVVNLSLGSALSGKCDIAFHLNPRLPERVVVRNSYQANFWGTEERDGAFPLQRDQNFELIILVTDSCYKTAFNGKHFCNFVHRIPKAHVSSLVIQGDLMIHQIKMTDPRTPMPHPVQAGYAPAYNPMQYGAPGYPPAQPPHGYPVPTPAVVHVHHTAAYPTGVAAPPQRAAPSGYPCPKPPKAKPQKAKATIALPLMQPLRNGVNPGTVIRIKGMPKSDAKHIRINFLSSNKENTAFHFNPRFADKVVVRNSKCGNWGTEERQQPKFPFAGGRPFDLIIYSDPDKYQVTVDGENFTTFKHRLRNLGDIRFLQIHGDLELYSIQI